MRDAAALLGNGQNILHRVGSSHALCCMDQAADVGCVIPCDAETCTTSQDCSPEYTAEGNTNAANASRSSARTPAIITSQVGLEAKSQTACVCIGWKAHEVIAYTHTCLSAS